MLTFRIANVICRGGPPRPPKREIHTTFPPITRPNPAKTFPGRRSGLPLQFCREKCGLARTTSSVDKMRGSAGSTDNLVCGRASHPPTSSATRERGGTPR